MTKPKLASDVIKISEKDFASQLEDLLEIYQWHWCHFRPAQTAHGWRTAITGHKGFVDYVAIKGGRCLFIEIKGDTGKLTPGQELWATLLGNCPGAEYYLWRPGQLEEIARILSNV